LPVLQFISPDKIISHSSYTLSLDEEIFDLVEKDIEKYSKMGDIILSGDMNCRTGNEQPDLIEDDQRIEFNNFLAVCLTT
jgi:hypothetical protein